MRIGKFLRAVVPAQGVTLARRLAQALDPHTNLSYAQEGEDMVLLRLLNWRNHGFYVDVGAHHPFRFSNTAMLHKLGWRGINIDADLDLMRAFEQHRPGDTNLTVGVSDAAGRLRLHKFDDPALNTFDDAIAENLVKAGVYKEVSRHEVTVERLEVLLAAHLAPRQSIDLMNIDAEGRDMNVLRSNDWTRFRPGVVLVEQRARTIADALAGSANIFLSAQGYELIAKTVNTLIFRDQANALA